jgi:hypothetical protein
LFYSYGKSSKTLPDILRSDSVGIEDPYMYVLDGNGVCPDKMNMSAGQSGLGGTVGSDKEAYITAGLSVLVQHPDGGVVSRINDAINKDTRTCMYGSEESVAYWNALRILTGRPAAGYEIKNK